MRRRANRVVATWEGEGWELVDEDSARLRTRLTFGRATSKPSVARRLAVLSGLVALLILAGTAGWMFHIPARIGDALDQASHDKVKADADSDRDGIPDQVEVAGWTTQSGSRFTTDPDRADSDSDGLPDGLEAGQLVTTASTRVYAGLADPRRTDTDGDRIGDADEFFLDMNPGVRDTDEDGLDDDEELDFGSDPTRVNGDEDQWTDSEEHARGSDPLSYDLTNDQRVDAAKAGAKYGDCYTCALDQGLRDEQVESVFYLAGQTGSGVAVYGDIRDLAYNLWKHKLVAAAVAVVGLIPVYGDAAKISATVSKFAARSDRAATAAYDFVKRLPNDVQKHLPAKLTRRGVTLPKELADGPTDNVVYLWKGTADCPTYVGITKNFAQRNAQHARAGRCFVPEQLADGLSRGQAHAIEEACIVQGGLGTAASTLQNHRHSIDLSKSYYDDAVAWGTAALMRARVSCR